ncbi:MAG TPA: hypothetical protein VLD67_18805 [Vicinamibacterales bacterium]|nr:hypothetical protein [Vicinamibacterales bacterium]
MESRTAFQDLRAGAAFSALRQVPARVLARQRPLIDRFHNGAQPIDQFVFEDRDGATTSSTAAGATATSRG